MKHPRKDALGHIALFMPGLGGGGVERVMFNLARVCMERGYRVDLLVCRNEGSFQKQIPPQLNVIALRSFPDWWARLLILVADPKGVKTWLQSIFLPFQGFEQFRCFPDLLRYLRRERPAALLSAMTKPNFMAVWARQLVGAPKRVVVSEHNTFSRILDSPSKKNRLRRRRLLPPMVKHVYSGADTIVAVSNGVATDLTLTTGILRERITTIYNPIVTPQLVGQAAAPLDHPWLQPGAPPLVLGVGRLHEQKDFPTLLKAFARVRAKQAAHLMILGEADAKHATFQSELMTLAAQLGIVPDVALLGFVANPFAYLARADLFVLSSAWEGLPSVLIEALACGCPVVSTDCPSGPREILENGKYGPLVPVGDDVALAEAMLSVLHTPPDRDWLRSRGVLFAVNHVADRYLEVLLS
jgi:glycosyltransferase involved in cell wall biosynthesis